MYARLAIITHCKTLALFSNKSCKKIPYEPKIGITSLHFTRKFLEFHLLVNNYLTPKTSTKNFSVTKNAFLSAAWAESLLRLSFSSLESPLLPSSVFSSVFSEAFLVASATWESRRRTDYQEEWTRWLHIWILCIPPFHRLCQVLAFLWLTLRLPTCTATALHTPPILRSSDLTPASRV